MKNEFNCLTPFFNRKATSPHQLTTMRSRTSCCKKSFREAEKMTTSWGGESLPRRPKTRAFVPNILFPFYLAEMKLVWCEVNGAGRQLPPGTIDGLFYHLEAHHPLHCAKPHFHLVDLMFHNFVFFFLFQTKHSL